MTCGPLCLLQKIMHTRKRHQDMFQDLNRKLQHAEKDKESPTTDSKVSQTLPEALWCQQEHGKMQEIGFRPCMFQKHTCTTHSPGGGCLSPCLTFSLCLSLASLCALFIHSWVGTGNWVDHEEIWVESGEGRKRGSIFPPLWG